MATCTLCVFEDDVYSRLLPITYTKAVFEIICGSRSLLDRLTSALKPEKVILIARDYLKDKLHERTGFTVNEADVEGDTLIVNGRLLLDDHALSLIKNLKRGEALIQGDTLLAMKLGEGIARGAITNRVFKPHLVKALANLKEVNLKTINYPWDLIELTPRMLHEIAEVGEPYHGDDVKVFGDPKMFRVKGEVEIEGPVVVDVRHGPVVIGEKCIIEGFTRIEGPTYIGDNSIIRGAYVRSGCFIGPTCRIGVGSELESTIIAGFTNKQHLGLIAHSYIGEWVNLGAGTNTSDLKNTYGTVKMTINGVKVDSGLIKLGCIIGDYVKTSIGTQIYTGKKIGPFSHLHGFIFEDVPSFTIWAKSFGLEPIELTLESALETQRRMYERRGVKQTQADIELVKKLFELTAEERSKAGVKRGRFSLS